MTKDDALRQQLLSNYTEDPDAIPADAADLAAARQAGGGDGGAKAGGQWLGDGVREQIEQLEPYGPDALVMAGFRAEEYAMARALLDAAGARDVKVLPATAEMLHGTVGAAVAEPEVDWAAARAPDWIRGGAWGSQRCILFSGLPLSAQATVIELLESEGLPPICVTMALESNAARRLGDVMADAVKDQRQRKQHKLEPWQQLAEQGRVVEEGKSWGGAGPSLGPLTGILGNKPGKRLEVTPPPRPPASPPSAGPRPPKGAAASTSPPRASAAPAPAAPPPRRPAAAAGPEPPRRDSGGGGDTPPSSEPGGAFPDSTPDFGGDGDAMSAWFNDPSTGPAWEIPWTGDGASDRAAVEEAVQAGPPAGAPAPRGWAGAVAGGASRSQGLDDWLAAVPLPSGPEDAQAPGADAADPGGPVDRSTEDIFSLLDDAIARGGGRGRKQQQQQQQDGEEDEDELVEVTEPQTMLEKVREAIQRGADPSELSQLLGASAGAPASGGGGGGEGGGAGGGSSGGGVGVRRSTVQGPSLPVVEPSEALPPPPLKKAPRPAVEVFDSKKRRLQDTISRKLNKEAAEKLINLERKRGGSYEAAGSSSSGAAAPAPAPPRAAGPGPKQQQQQPPRRVYGPAPPTPEDKAAATFDQPLLNLRPGFQKALEGKNIQFVDLSKLPQKYREQYAAGMQPQKRPQQRQQPWQQGAPRQAAAAPSPEQQHVEPEGQAEDSNDPSGEQQQQQAPAPRGARRASRLGAKLPGTAASMRGPITASDQARLVPKVDRPKLQRVEISSPEDSEQLPAGFTRVGQEGAGDDIIDVGGGGFEAADRSEADIVGSATSEEGPEAGLKGGAGDADGAVVLGVRQLRELLDSAGAEGLDARRLLAEALALGCVIPPEAATEAGAELPTEAEVEAARAEAVQAFDEFKRDLEAEAGEAEGGEAEDEQGQEELKGSGYIVEDDLDADEDPNAIRVQVPGLGGKPVADRVPGGGKGAVNGSSGGRSWGTGWVKKR